MEMKGLSFLKKCSYLCRTQMILYFIVVIILLIYYHYTQNQPHLKYQRDLQVISNSEQLKVALPLDTRRNDYDDEINDNSKYEVFNKETNQKMNEPVDVEGNIEVKCNHPINVRKSQAADSGINATHIQGVLMERIHVNYIRNIYFTLKTTHKNFVKRLFPLMLTWLQLVDKNKLSIITDKCASEQIYYRMIRKAGFHIIDTDCKPDHSHFGLCCKMGIEFASYYKAVEKHLKEKENYQWYCHFDDDVYVNLPKLDQLLQQYDPRKPYYIGSYPKILPSPYVPLTDGKIYRIIHGLKYPLKYKRFRFSCGPAFCISYTLMMKARKYFHGANLFRQICKVSKLPDDMTVGLVITSLMGYHLTDVQSIKHEFTHVPNTSLEELTNYTTVSSTIVRNKSLMNLASSLKTPLPPDPTMFLLYHCLLYPTVSWCSSVREALNRNN